MMSVRLNDCAEANMLCRGILFAISSSRLTASSALHLHRPAGCLATLSWKQTACKATDCRPPCGQVGLSSAQLRKQACVRVDPLLVDPSTSWQASDMTREPSPSYATCEQGAERLVRGIPHKNEAKSGEEDGERARTPSLTRLCEKT